MRRIALLLIAATAATTAVGQNLIEENRHHGYFFRPSRSHFFYNPHDYPPIRNYGRSSYHYRGSYGGHGGSLHYNFRPAGASTYRGIYSLQIDSSALGPVVRANTADLIFEVDPPEALVYIDDKVIGSAADFATYRDRYMLISGEHTLRIARPGYVDFETAMEVPPDHTLHLDIELERKPLEPR